MKATKIDMQRWERRMHYEFFKGCDNPFFGITANVDVTHLVQQTKEHQHSFFLASLYLSLKAANEIKEFRYRIKDDEVYEVEETFGGSTILAEDNTFRFAYFYLRDNYLDFEREGKASIEKYSQINELLPTEGLTQDGINPCLHYSTIPWISFTGFNHARAYKIGDSVPKIVFGKYFKEGDRLKMPLSVEIHHSLADGYHVGLYFERFQELLDTYKLV
ncbi:chloramphenicol acetyltransferase [Algivirga pacifica]|uniref:Chloramphenicol acetyltransferase n=1 Tax=Algivirga pacifica TaxID=1162670 RepID=A0ABP9CXK5_9BACT